jgi:hypothetical protein
MKKIVRKELDLIKLPSLTDEQQAELKALSDTRLDASNAP